jgi:hypothetical protein
MMPFERQYSSISYEMMDDDQKGQKGTMYAEKIRNERGSHQVSLDRIREESQQNLKGKIDTSQEKVNELSATSGRIMERYNR